MRLLLSTLALFILPAIARADTTDDFVLTGEGHIVTFSAAATTTGHQLFGAGHSDGGFFIDADVTDNGVARSNEYVQIFPAFGTPVNGGLSFYSATRQYTLDGPVLYTGPSYNATFLTGTFHLVDFYTPVGGTPNSPFTLTITPEVSAVPEPPSLLLLATGIFGLVALTAGNRVRSECEPFP